MGRYNAPLLTTIGKVHPDQVLAEPDGAEASGGVKFSTNDGSGSNGGGGKAGITKKPRVNRKKAIKAASSGSGPGVASRSPLACS